MTRPIPSDHGIETASPNERAGTYLFFARLLREAPSEVLLRDIVQQRLLTCAEQCGGGPACTGTTLDVAEDATWPQQAEAIAVEYARLFAVPGAQAVRPYESVYCDTLTVDTSTACSPYFEPEPQASGLAGFLHGVSTVAVRDAYRRAGFELDAASHELPDHVAIELEFMGRLLERGTLDQANVFFAEHLGRWVFRCLEDIAQNAHVGFYRVVIDTLGTFLRREAALR